MKSFVLHFFSAILFATLVHSYAITGATGGVDPASGQRPARQEFTTFASSGAAFDLYIQALKSFTDDDQSQLLSYYQVSGIHGRPYIPWDGVDGSFGGGYCTHSSILFPPWHRPYLALFEQILWEKAQSIASTYPDDSRSRYQDAARTLRMPYWDWALNSTMSSELNQPSITVNTPSGNQDLDNPLYMYTFHPLSPEDLPPDEDGEIATYPTTLRYPDADGKSQPELANAQLANNAQSLHDLTYQLISDQSRYAPFSNTAFRDAGGRYNSVENLHNAIHSLVGNGGHMSFVPYSAFDPIFWLHHTNVDRLFAIWQAIHPDSYVTSQSSSGTFTIAAGSTEDSNTPLTPFHSNAANDIYTSNTARNTRDFGYTYPEVRDWETSSPSDLSAQVRRAVNALYNPTGSLSRRRRSLKPRRKRNAEPLQSVAHSIPAFSPNDTTATTTPLLSGTSSRPIASLVTEAAGGVATNTNITGTEGTKDFVSKTTYEYFANVHVSKSALNSTFFIHFYIGEPYCADKDLSFASNLVGTAAILFAPRHYPSNSPAPTTYAQVSLTHALLSSPQLHSLEPEAVIPFLKKELVWRVQLTNDTAVAADCAALKRGGFGVFVVGRTVEEPECGDDGAGDEFPTYGDMVTYAEATAGKKGGEGRVEGYGYGYDYGFSLGSELVKGQGLVDEKGKGKVVNGTSVGVAAALATTGLAATGK